MLGRTGFRLFFCLFILAETVNSQWVPYNTKTYGCKTVYDFSSNVTKAVFSNSFYGISNTFNASQFPAVIRIPANSSIQLSIEITTSTGAFNRSERQNSSEICCNDSVAVSGNCFFFNLTCPVNCAEYRWPTYIDFYKTRNCSLCSCEYCYIGNRPGWYQFKVPIHNNQPHLFNIMFPRVEKNTTEIIQPRSKFLQSYRLPTISNDGFLPFPQDDSEHFTISPVKGTFDIRPINATTLPKNGIMKLYLRFKTKDTDVFSVKEYDIRWYSRLECEFAAPEFVYMNDPLIAMNCKNAINKPIIYDVSNPRFQMKENVLLFKELTTKDPTKLTLSALYAGLKDSIIQLAIELEVQVKKSLLTLYGCKADINFSLLKYTNLSFSRLQSNVSVVGTPRSYVINLPPNRTTTLELYSKRDNSITPFTITVNSPEICCNETISTLSLPICFSVDLKCPQSCQVVSWPKHDLFYNISNCESCSCQYCYIGPGTGMRQLMIPLKKSTQKIRVNIPSFSATLTELKKQRTFFFTPYPLSKDNKYTLLPGGNSSNYIDYFRIVYLKDSAFLQVKDANTFPRDGRVQLYIHPLFNSSQVLEIVNITWYSPPNCTYFYLILNYINDPLLKMNCENFLQVPIEYEVNDTKLQMKDNFLYLKELTTGHLAISITAKYKDIKAFTTQQVDITPNVPHPLNVSNCEARLHFDKLNYTNLNLYSQRLGLNISLSNTKDYNTTLPPNKTIIFNLKVDNDMEYTITTKSPELCCKHTVVKSYNCIKMGVTCGNKCAVSEWLKYADFYQTSDCNLCSCQYCYLGNRSTEYKFAIPVNATVYTIPINVTQVEKISIVLRKQRKELLTSVNLPNSTFLHLCPQPKHSMLNKYFNLDQKGISFILNPKNVTILPSYGRMNIYFQPIKFLTVSQTINEYTVVWSSGIECNITYNDYTYLNEPLLHMNCEKDTERRIIYKISDQFLMKDNTVYLKDLAAYGLVNTTITAMYEGLEDSAKAFDITFKLKGIYSDWPVVFVSHCEAMFLLANLNYTSINLYSQQMRLNITLSNRKDQIENVFFLPANKTIIFNLKVDNDMEYTITTKSPDYCCNISGNEVIKDICFNVILTCPTKTCPVLVWPDFKDFYKFSQCKGCACSYCYIGDGGKWISLSIPMKNSSFQLFRSPPNIRKITTNLTVSYQDLLSKFQSPAIVSNLSSGILTYSQDSYFDSFFEHTGNFSIQLRKNKIPPQNGHIQLYLYSETGERRFLLEEVELTWYYPLRCNVSYLPRNFLNDPLLSVDCEKTFQLPVVFSPSNDKFQMKDNLMYQKELTTYGSFNFSITANYVGLNETATKVKVSITLKENTKVLTVIGCKVILDRRFIDGRIDDRLISSESTIRVLTANQDHLIFSIPEKKRSLIHINPGYRNVTFSFTVTSQGKCCRDTVIRSGLCFNFALNCEGLCLVSTWPEFSNFFKTSQCGRCNCHYCSQHSLNSQQKLLLPLNTSTTHLLTVGPMSVKKNKIQLILPRKELMDYELTRSRQVQLYFPFKTFFTALYTDVSAFIKSSNLSSNGQQHIYLQRKGENGTVVDAYDIIWYSAPSCQVEKLNQTYLNSPLFKLNCERNSQIPIKFNLNNRDFQMKDNFVYRKNLMINGSVNFSITAKYEGLNDSLNNIATTVNVSLKVLLPRDILILENCKASFHLAALNYWSINIFSKKMSYNKTVTDRPFEYRIDLPPNETTTFYLTPNHQHMAFTFTAKSPEYCCNVNITEHYYYRCYTLKLKCQNGCYGIYPETRDFFTIPGSSKCSSIYCYRGGNRRTFQMSVPLQRNEHNYSVTMQSIVRRVKIVEFLIGGKELKFRTRNYSDFRVWPQKYMSYVRSTYVNGSRSLFLAANKTFLPEGHFHIFFREPISQYPESLTQLFNPLATDTNHFSVYAFKKVHCNIEKIDYDQEKWPLPMFSFNCTNSLNMTLKYLIDDYGFHFNEFKLYMNWLPQVNTILFVGVSYRNFSSSRSVYNVSIPLKRYFMSLKNISINIDTRVKVESVTHRPGNISDYVIHVPKGKGVSKFIKDFFSHELNLDITILEYYAPVGRLYITNLTAVEDSKNRHVFTCHTNSTFTDLTYQWYWNENEITNDISSSMQNGKSQGRIILSGLNKDDSGNVTCHVTKTDYIPATRRRSISMNSFPEVKINASYHIIQNKKPVNVTCEYVSKSGNSELIFEVNNQQIKERKVTLSEEATVSCYGIYNGLKGKIKTLKILKAVGKKLCPAETYNNIKWPETVENTIANATCSEEFSGTISRLCSPDGIWNTPDNSNCLKKAISDAKSQLDRIALGVGKGFEAAVENLANATKQSIGAKDITETIDALKVVSTITNKSKEVTKKEVKNVVDIVNNLIEGDKQTAWTKLEDKEPSAAASILKQMEDFGNVASQKVNETVSISTDNLVIEYNKVSVEKNFNFPAENSSQPKWVEESDSRVFIPSTILKDKFGANETVSMNAVIFRNMKDLLPQAKNVSSDVNSYVLAISFGRKLENLTENVNLSFSHLSPGYDEPSCNFWDFDINPEFGGYWSTRGCEVSFSNSTYTQCSCDHLTNFAILMNVVQHKDRKVLGIITKVGCSISIIALILTIILYAICWKSITSQDVSKSQSTLLMNLCVSLIIAYLIFLTLVEGPREKNACTAIAALLHYFFLVVFFTMFAEGLDMAITLTVVFNPKFSRLPWLLVLCWVAPAIIVGISLASTNTHGFGNEVFCWLTPESNVIWSFIIPALIIILANIVCVILIVKSLLSAYCMLRESVKQRLRTGARAIAILTPLLGFTWIFGIFAVNEETVVFEYIFTIASSLQGLFIFIAYCIFNKQIRKGLNLSRTEKTSDRPTKQSIRSSYGTKSTEISSSGKSATKVPTSFSDFSEMHSDSKQEHSFEDSMLRFSDNGLKSSIKPYYINPTLRISSNSEKL